MKPGEMLKALHTIEGQLVPLIEEGPDAWQSLNIDYEPPRVERLWRQVGDLRVSLHRIHPCAQALYHPHPWPSAIRIVSGLYEMGIAESPKLLFQNLVEADREVARMMLVAGTEYEMVHPTGWHYVKPHSMASLSIMVTAKPWDPPVFDHGDFGQRVELQPLTNQTKQELLTSFHWWLTR